MLAAEKLAPLDALQSSPPAYVNDVRVDGGADEDLWAYINAPPKAREKPRFICVVARSDKALELELRALESELAVWATGARESATEFVQRGLDVLRERQREIGAALKLAGDSAIAQATLAGELGSKADSLRATIEPLRAETKPEVRGQVALLDLELGRVDASRSAAQLATDEHRARVHELARELDSAKLAVVEAAASFDADVSARLGKHVPPLPVTNRIAELQAELGRVVVHASDAPTERLYVEAESLADAIASRADWLRG